MIPTSNNEMEIENGDFMKILLDNGTNQLEDKFFLSKKKLLNAQKGKNELFDMLKMKLKGLDMQIVLMQSNKEMLKSDDLLCVETLLSLITLAKNDKVLFPPIYKKVRTLTSLLIKNQTNIKHEANYSTLVKFVVYILNLGYEHSTFQQLADLVAADNELFKLFCDELFNKIFKGRNVNIKAKDTRFIIRFLMTKYISPCNIVKTLLLYLKPKDNGGARTPHQVNLILSLIGYVAEIIVSKCDQMHFKEKEIAKVFDAFKETIKQNNTEITIDNDEHTNDDNQNKLKKQYTFFAELENMYLKIFNAFLKSNPESQTIISNKEDIDNLFKKALKKYPQPIQEKESKPIQEKESKSKPKQNK